MLTRISLHGSRLVHSGKRQADCAVQMPGWISILIFAASVAVILVGVFILAFFGTGSGAGSH